MADLYAIVGGLKRALFMLKAEVPFLQLRFKDAALHPYIGEVSQWPLDFPRTKLIVNDDLEFAVSAKAWGVGTGKKPNVFPLMM